MTDQPTTPTTPPTASTPPTTSSTTPQPRTMTAWRQTTYGGPEVVRAEQVPVPTPGRGEVLLKIRATALNSADVRLMRGDPMLVRLAFGPRRPKQAVRGMDAAGTVVAVGEDVTGFAVGDEVVGELPGGALAEYAVAPTTRLVHRPAELAPETAAALPLAGGTAWQALERGGIGSDAAGKRILVIGASGGVGTYTVQLAALRGAEVWATCGERNLALVERLGAARTLDYRSTPVEDLPAGHFDVVVELARAASLRALRRLLRPGGSVVMVGGDGGKVLGPMPRMPKAALLSLGSDRKLRSLLAVARTDVLTELLALTVDGRLAPVVERTWPLSEAVQALAHVDAGHTVGKVVVVQDAQG